MEKEPDRLTILPHELSREDAKRLMSDGYIIIDNFFEKDFADSLREELRILAATGAMLPNQTHFGGLIFSKPNIFELDCHSPDMQERFRANSCPCLAQWFRRSASEWVPELSRAVPELELLPGDACRSVKLQWNSGGGSFPLHFDNPAAPSQRQLSALLYLNPTWQPSDGGRLVLAPFLQPEIPVPPLHNRVVLFLSDRVLHRVEPTAAAAERFCVTTWIDGAAANLPEHCGLRLPPAAMADLPGTAAWLRGSPCQRALSRAVYAEEYERSLADCMAGARGGGLPEMMAAHRAFLRGVESNSALARLVRALRERKPTTTTTTNGEDGGGRDGAIAGGRRSSGGERAKKD